MTEHRIGTQEQWQAERDELLEPAMAFYGLLDRTPKGRDESATEPLWIQRHDEYK
ncbi:MAG: hypothetical protein ABSH36_01250 [Solirubrobacteraceae bacterium]